jgi:hypothetical protein
MPAGLHPFWFWNARISAEGIRSQLAAMVAQGIRGVYLHPRQGLAQPYLSAAFLDLVQTAIDEARKLGLSVHLYDEYPYPSGAAGGEVVQGDPALAGSRLRHIGWDVPGGRHRSSLPAGRVVACLAFPRRNGHVRWDAPVDLAPDTGMLLGSESYFEGGLGPYNDRRYFAGAPQPTLETVLPPGEHHVAAAVLVPIADHKYWGSFPDILNPKAVERFAELTHERYARHLGSRLRAVGSVFVDEIAPWASATAVEEFTRWAGADACSLLIALGEPDHPRHLDALVAMTGIQLELFENSFERPVADWCRSHGLRYAGEKPSLRLSQLRWLDVPGCEPGHVKAGAAPDDILRDVLRAPIRGNARATASAAYLYGKQGALCECYHSLGWDATLQDAKLLADVLVALGIRWLVPHAFYYCVHGLRKHDAPPSFPHMPYWPLFGSLSRHVDELWRHFDGTHPDAAIAVVEPSWGLPDKQGQYCYELLQRALVRCQRDWLTVDTDTLLASRVEEGSAVVRDVRFQAVAVPPMRRMEPALHRWLDEFEAGGGTVAWLACPADVTTAVDTLARRCPASLRFTVRQGSRDNILCTARRSGSPDDSGAARLWFLVNIGPEPVELACSRSAGLAAIRLAGEPPPVFRAAGDQFLLRLESFESVLLTETAAGSRTAEPDSRRRAAADPLQVNLAAGRWTVRPCSPNVLRLGHWRLHLVQPEDPATGDGPPGSDPIVTPAPLANQLREGAFHWMPRVVTDFGQPARLELPPLRLCYTATFDCAMTAIDGREGLQLAIEPDSITGCWQLRVNGAGPFGAADLIPVDAHTPGCLGLSLNGLVRPGANEVSVTVEATSLDQGLRNALYVVGDAGVEVTALPSGECRGRLVPPARWGKIGDWTGSGLPFYAGVVEYEADLGNLTGTLRARVPGRREDPASAATEPAGEEPVQVHAVLPPQYAGPIEMAFGDGPWRPLPWSPWRLEIPPAELATASTIRVRVYSGLARAFEGRWFDPMTHRYRLIGTDEDEPGVGS